MKKTYSKLSVVLLGLVCIIFGLSSNDVNGQFCNSGGCFNYNTQYPSYSLSTSSSSWTAAGSCFYGGEYAVFNVTSGNTYEWSTCGDFGGYQGTSFDAELTLFNSSWGLLCFNNNSGRSSCPNAPYIAWTATYTGQVRVLVSNAWFAACQNYSGACASIVWRQSAAGCVAPAAPTLFSPTVVSSSQINLSWTPVTNATGYNIYYGVSGCSSLSFLTSWSSTSVGVIQLNPSTTYYFAIQATGSCGNSGFNNCQSAMTLTNCTTPSSPNIFSPSNQTTNSFQANWSSSSGATAYYLDVSTNSSFSSLIYNGLYVGNQTSYYVSGLNCNSSYYYRVRAGNSCGTSGNSAYTFVNTTVCCVVPSTPSISGFSNQTINSFRANWNFSSGATAYYLDVSSNSAFSSLIYNDLYIGNQNFYIVTGLSCGNNYFYRVRAGNSCGTSTNSSIASASTSGCCIIPAISLDPQTHSVSSGQSTTFSIGMAQGNNLSYQWQYSSNSGSTWVNLNNSSTYSGVFTNSLFISQPTAGLNLYRFRCYVSNSCGNDLSLSATLGVNMSIAPEPRAREENFPMSHVSDPISLSSGAYLYKHLDFSFPTKGNPLIWKRYYNSRKNNFNYSLGHKWNHNFDFRVTNQADTVWVVNYGDGHENYFVPNGDGTSNPYFGGTFETLVRNGNNTYTLTFKNQEMFLFDQNGILISITDRNGNITSLNYSGGNLSSITGPGGRGLSFSYDVNNRIKTVTAPDGRTINYSYDSNGDLVNTTDAKGGSTTFIYDNAHQIMQIIDARTNILLTNVYDNSGHVISQSDGLNNTTNIVYNTPPPGDATVTFPGGATRFYRHDALYRIIQEADELSNDLFYSYDTDNNRISFTDENNNATNYLYDSKGNVTTINKPLSSSTQITYNSKNDPLIITNALSDSTKFKYSSSGNLTSVTNALLNSRNASYDNAGQITAITDALNHTTSFSYNSSGDLVTATNLVGESDFTYDSVGRIIKSIDANGHPTTFTYDNNDFIKTITDALGQSIEYFYDANNNLIQLKDKKGYSTFLTYDKKNRLTIIQDPKGGKTKFAYDVRDNLISVTDPVGNVVSYTYDLKNRLIKTTNTLGSTDYSRDGVGNLLTETDATFHITTYTNDALYRITAIADALNNTSNFNYDALGQLLNISDALGRKTSYTFDPIGQLTKVADAANVPSGFTHDANGNRLTVTDPNGHTTHFSFDVLNRLVSTKDASGNVDSVVYDAKGNIISEIQANGTIATYKYDLIDRLKQVSYSTGEVNFYDYDPNDNLTTMGNALGNTTFTYDSSNQVISMIDAHNNHVTYTYNAAGLRKSVTYPGNRTVSYFYNGVNALIKVTDWKGHSINYTYDSAGRLIKITYPNGTYAKYVYDNAGRMTEIANYLANNSIINQSIFTLDSTGNRIQEQRIEPLATNLTAQSLVYSHAQNNALLSTTNATYNNDASGNRLSETGANAATFTWTANNLLASYTRGTQPPVNLEYDPLGSRTKRVQGSNITQYLLDLTQELSQVLEEQDTNGTAKASYIYGLGLIARVDSAGNFQYYHFDAQGNTIALTDSTGQITDTYTYKPFGELITHLGNTNQPFLFLGKHGIMAEGSDLYYIRARYYDAKIGGFILQDPLMGFVSDPQTFNRFIYGLNNPLSIMDVTGLYGERDNSTATSNTDFETKVLEGLFSNSYDGIINQTNDAIDNGRYFEATMGFIAAMGYKAAQGAMFLGGGAEVKAVKYGSGIVKGSKALLPAAKELAAKGGIGAANGIKITGFTEHGLNRAIGDFSRLGVKPDAILNALKKPLKINNVVTDQFGRQSQRFIGQFGEVVVNTQTGKIISVNPTSTNKAASLLKHLGQ